MERVSTLLQTAAGRLRDVSPSARLDAELLLRHVLGWERHELICRDSQMIAREKIEMFEALLSRRLNHEPVAYIREKKEFWGLEFRVGPGVLIPRPATELIVELAVKYSEEFPCEISTVDLGTGSGAIAVAVSHELKKRKRAFRMLATDQSEKALDYARQNIKAHGLENLIETRQTSWLEELSEYDMILCNPPYIAEDDSSPAPGLRFEPQQALFSGPEGLNDLKFLVRQVPEHLKPGGVFLCEIGAMQSAAIADFAEKEVKALTLKIHQDLSGLDRVIECRTGERL